MVPHRNAIQWLPTMMNYCASNLYFVISAYKEQITFTTTYMHLRQKY